MLSEQQMRAAIAARDSAYDGRFFYGVPGSGVFCRPSCPARAAGSANLRFFASAEAAVFAGFRPCRRCRPLDNGPADERLVRVARHLEANAEQRLTLATLASLAGLSPSRLQRLFKAAFGVSPKAFQDALRMQRFKAALKDGETVTDAIFASGFGSLSRVYGEAARNIGMTPKAYRAGGSGESIAWACRDTSLGPLMMAATDRGVCFVQFGDDEAALLAQLGAEFPGALLTPSPACQAPELDAWIGALEQHLDAAAPLPALPLDLRGTAFQMKVWRFLLGIEEGEVLSYSELAARMNAPRSVRAVASACAANRIGVLVPCHRVLRSDGGLGGYRWGLERKRALLDTERARRSRESGQ
ncbi:bifunctional transcriptional activator/DNA repair enzyme protein Ada [Marinobacterium nitratireducens]|uniref:methylated-DNA--[protein]-cysteine S-methyltransferase n=1 Tax=Marinobacterium nitratireducens TaxID=518897 RepID=A0A917Z9S5_9GAMM|nr:bifunctional DNA-binding transcriptional regulator/O6-methylguanine-DNA methyltransferase Ada [Marinobacterium nitratireducens]GGO79019.1 bifunctional transcriptional activator/DNA repair enzyme protein Ada [Marinobacterium nitratireducens]